MPGSSFWHHKRFNRSEQIDDPSQDTGRDRNLSSNHHQHSAIDSHTSNTIQPLDGPSSSLTPLDDRPTGHNAPSSFYQFGANPTGIALSEMSRVPPPPLEQSSRRDERDQVLRRDSSESLSSTSTYRQPSFDPSIASKRDGTIALSNFDSVLSSRRSSVVPENIVDQTGEPATERDSQSRPESEEVHEGSAAVQHSQSANNASVLQPNTPPMAFGKDRDTSPLIDAGCDVDKCESPQQVHIEITNDILPIGKWRCCECQRGHEIYRFEAGQHLISILNCLCKHRSCKSCTFQGNVKRFAPIDDAAGVASIPVLEGDGRTIRFGVICRTCGLSWRAKRIQEAKPPGLLRRKLYILPKKVKPLHKLRNTRSMIHLGFLPDSHTDVSRPGSASSTSRSILTLGSASDTQAKDTKPTEQAQGVFVRFYGIECTCGSITNASSICFQVVDTAEVNGDGASKGQTGVEVIETAESRYTPEMKAKGYGTPFLHLNGRSHANPLRSNPVLQSDLS
ncbi:hypothetical protein EKO04_009437 [Ascochyta lentis]|uniref:Probable double zinc ribbon domain-containing protein n=1 Tax=Ascochyta lentis TaxID=205686 RepID=A0A8H7IWU6_9PLEO|nr:hypothetical protein EKO04_009437 [Ascochyta lentis]